MGSRVKKSLAESLLSLPDPRGFQGRDHRLPSIIMLIILGKLCGEKSMAGIQRFGRLLSKKQKAKLGFIKHNTPALGTLTETMKAVDAVALQSILSQAMHKGKTIQQIRACHHLLKSGFSRMLGCEFCQKTVNIRPVYRPFFASFSPQHPEKSIFLA